MSCLGQDTVVLMVVQGMPLPQYVIQGFENNLECCTLELEFLRIRLTKFHYEVGGGV